MLDEVKCLEQHKLSTVVDEARVFMDAARNVIDLSHTCLSMQSLALHAEDVCKNFFLPRAKILRLSET